MKTNSKKLKLNKETLRDLSKSQLEKAAGGQKTLTYWFCPSGATWFRECDPPA